ncbi:hypothetical protein FZEAL_5417 [Fusarium zealandicum]|uniref:AAA+ ATPase domain-containing protein n=1 Tax=Fusarium zealandicum TaxID=1053134 RepID=A0A8H4UKI4_9HYPO|nr:hypothetical protein FZEAL_5417 [Fusarium zealandicum]
MDENIKEGSEAHLDVVTTEPQDVQAHPIELDRSGDTNMQEPKAPIENQEPTGGLDSSHGKQSSVEKQEDSSSIILPWPQRVNATGLTGGITYEWLKDMTSRVVKLESMPAKDETDNSNPGIGPKQQERIKTEPKVRYCNWEKFKNRYSLEDSTYAVEALLSGDDLDAEMEKEQLRRLSKDESKKILETKRKKPVRRPEARKDSERQRIDRVRINSAAILSLLRKVTGETSWSDEPHTFLKPFKILVHFYEKMEDEFKMLQAKYEEPRHLQPVSAQDNTHGLSPSTTSDQASNPQLRTQISTDTQPTVPPEEKTQASPNCPSSEAAPEPVAQSGRSAEKGVSDLSGNERNDEAGDKETPELPILNPSEYYEIKAYMEFAKTKLLPTYKKFENSDHRHRTKVQYADLWSLFRPGELIFQRNNSQAEASRQNASERRSVAAQSGGPRLWRLHYIGSESVDWTVDNLDDTNGDLRRNKQDSSVEINIEAYYIDFDGASYKAVNREWTITRFPGEKEVTKLEVYPVRFEKDYNSVIGELEENGKRFQNLLLQSHMGVQHEGWTLTHDPAGDRLLGGSSENSEYIDSEAIIDFQEAYQMHPFWKPDFLNYIMDVFEPDTVYDDFTIIEWSGPDRSKVLRKTREVVIESDDVEALEWNRVAETDDFAIDPEVRLIERDPAKQKFTSADLALLPSRMFVYSLRQRRFVNADISNVKQVDTMSDPFNDLKISRPHKQLIRSIVQDHFEKKEIQRDLRSQGKKPVEQDFIPGKGKGLVILLHGAPGVGKTATAEAVASAHRKPLFQITCGDLGIDPTTVESRLSEIFRLANLWDCVLLLDEAEIFLSHREKKDDNLQRNAIVSIFLRTLEYYPGILFLTTNRVGALDEALNSRVHVSIYFKHLDNPQTLALFKMNLHRSELIAKQRSVNTGKLEMTIMHDEILEFAAENWGKSSEPWWNGRQIRNAFQIATSLAYANQRDGTDASSLFLGREHFEQVLLAIDEYQTYRHEIFHHTDNELAEHREERFNRVPSQGLGRRQNAPRQDSYRPGPPTRHRPAYSTSSSGARPTSERYTEADFRGQGSRGGTPTPSRGESSLSLDPFGPRPGAMESPSARGRYDDPEYDDY